METNIIITKGIPWRLVASYYKADGTIVPNVNTLTYQAMLQFRPSRLSTSVLYQTTSDAGGYITLDDTTATISAILPVSVLAGFTWDKATYHLYLKPKAGGDNIKLAFGQATMDAGLQVVV